MPSLLALTEALTQAAAITGPWAPLILFAATFVEHVVPPFPGDLLVVLGAWYAVNGELSWPLLLVFSTAGAVAGAWVDHRIGMLIGSRLAERAMHSRLLPPKRLAAFETAYRRWGDWLLLANRFLPGLRAFLFLAAGASGIPARRVMLLGGLSALAWNGLLLAAGGLVAKNLEELVGLVDRYMRGVGVVLGAVALLLLAWAAWRRLRARPGVR
ncbi:MAG: DedA family protein [Anaeromyxobacter sp.]|nr:DedA family protein [Anaeromyxobacter sp.]MBL0278135.1 DedA family protein [Anaeromyxobacter sp.]